MKRIFIIVLCFAIMLLGACSSPNPEASEADPYVSDSTQPQETTSEPPTETESAVYTSAPPASEETRPVISASSKTLCAGNFDIPIPEGFTVSSIEENYAALVSDDGDCVIGVVALDIIELDSEKAFEYLPMMYKSFLSKDADLSDVSVVSSLFGPFDIEINIYSEIRPGSNPVAILDFAFTDSWFAYVLMCKISIETGNSTKFISSFMESCAFAEYVGEPPRFDIAQ